MRPRWLFFSTAAALLAEMASWVLLWGGGRWRHLDLAMGGAVLGLHVFAAVLAAEGRRATAGPEASGVWWRALFGALLLPGVGPLVVVIRSVTAGKPTREFPALPSRTEALLVEADAPVEAEASPVASELPVFPRVSAWRAWPIIALGILALAQVAAAVIFGVRGRPLALWTVAAFQAGLALAAGLALVGDRRVGVVAHLAVVVASLALGAVSILGFARADTSLAALASAPQSLEAYGVVGILLILAFPQLVAHRWLAAEGARLDADEARRPRAWHDLGPWAASGQWLSLVVAGAVVLLRLGFPTIASGLLRFVLLVVAAVGVELALRSVGRIFSPGAALAPRTLILSALVSGKNPLIALLDALENDLGLSFRSSFTVRWVRRALGPLLGGLMIVLWLSTSLVLIGPTEQGVSYRWGRVARTAAVLQPGLHVKAPWPIDRVVRRQVTRVRHLDVGYVGRRGRRSLLWTSRHAKTEHKLLLGGGRELLNVNAIISYRIGDLSSYLAQYAKPDKVLEALAYRALLRRTAGKSLVAILTEDRAAFSRLLAKDLRRVCARRRLGVQILDVSLLGLHPPVAVASAYQGVVSAQLGIRTATIQAQRDAVTREERIRGRSREQVLQAEAKAAKREGRARGEAVRFTLTLKGRAKAPALYRFRKRLELLEARLGGLDLYVVDPLVATTTSSLWVDLRMIDNR